MAVKVLPEYFRSQRQLIIDTEALLDEQQQLSERAFRQRSESLAYEQNLLRMRYGRFLGEEDSALEHNDDDAPAHETDEHEHDSAHNAHGPENSAAEHSEQFGDAEGIIAGAGHQHDDSEHASLFDPKTKALLRNALNAMWSAWRNLAVIEPRASLPDQQRALRLIKEVQQASRIYLQRVGFEPPPIDESRRLSGEYPAVALPRPNNGNSNEHRTEEQKQIRKLLTQILDGDTLSTAAAAEILSLSTSKEEPQRAIELSKSLRLYRQQPNCQACRQQLSMHLYQLLPTPYASPALPRHTINNGSFSHWLQSRQLNVENEVRR